MRSEFKPTHCTLAVHMHVMGAFEVQSDILWHTTATKKCRKHLSGTVVRVRLKFSAHDATITSKIHLHANWTCTMASHTNLDRLCNNLPLRCRGNIKPRIHAPTIRIYVEKVSTGGKHGNSWELVVCCSCQQENKASNEVKQYLNHCKAYSDKTKKH